MAWGLNAETLDAGAQILITAPPVTKPVTLDKAIGLFLPPFLVCQMTRVNFGTYLTGSVSRTKKSFHVFA